MTDLITSFRNYGTPSMKYHSIITKGKKIPVQPTSVSRRKVQGLSNQKSKAPHSVKACIENHVGLGENQFAK